MMNSQRRTFLILSACAMLAADAAAQDWTRFRGPNGTGVSESKSIPVTWTEKDFRWRVTLPGESHSNPVIWGDRIFLTTCLEDSGARKLLCFDRKDGRLLWDRVAVRTPKEQNHKRRQPGKLRQVVNLLIPPVKEPALLLRIGG